MVNTISIPIGAIFPREIPRRLAAFTLAATIFVYVVFFVRSFTVRLVTVERCERYCARNRSEIRGRFRQNLFILYEQYENVRETIAVSRVQFSIFD